MFFLGPRPLADGDDIHDCIMLSGEAQKCAFPGRHRVTHFHVAMNKQPGIPSGVQCAVLRRRCGQRRSVERHDNEVSPPLDAEFRQKI